MFITVSLKTSSALAPCARATGPFKKEWGPVHLGTVNCYPTGLKGRNLGLTKGDAVRRQEGEVREERRAAGKAQEGSQQLV